MQAVETATFERPEHPVDVMERLALVSDWSFERADEDEIAILVEGQWSRYEVSITWIGDVEALHVSCAFELKTSERKRAEVAELVRLINAQMWLGHFDVWPSEQVVMFRHAHCLNGGAAASEAQARALVQAAVKACETYYQSFQFVLWAGRSPREALDFAMFATAGNA